MSLAEIFNENMNNLKDRINIIGEKYPNLVKAFSLKKSDPHIEKMISSFALISASLEYEVEKKMAKEIRSIFFNLNPEELETIPPKAIVKISSFYGQHFKIDKNKILRDNECLFRTTRDFYINDIGIKSYDKSYFNDLPCIAIEIEGNNLNEIKAIDLCVDINTINAVMGSEKSVTGYLKNRDEYFTEFECKIHDDFSLRNFAVKENHYTFLRIQDLKIHKNSENTLLVYLPIKYNFNLSRMSIQTNLCVIENRFKMNSSPFNIEEKTECIVPVDKTKQVINILNLYTSKGERIPNVKEDINGWHMIFNKNNISIYCESIKSQQVFVELECCQKFFELDNLHFEEYIPGKVHWVEMPGHSHEYIMQNQLNKIIQLMFLDNRGIESHLKNAGELLQTYNNIINVNFENIEIIESIKPMKISNYVLPKMIYSLMATVDTTNFLLLRFLVEDINKRTRTHTEFIFSTPLGELHFE